MADPILHIKDSYYFEVPKLLCPAHYVSRTQFPETWGSLDPEFQDWEFARMYKSLAGLASDLPAADTLKHDWHHWLHADHANASKPFDVYLREIHQGHQVAFATWKDSQISAAGEDSTAILAAKRLQLTDYLNNAELKPAGKIPHADYSWFSLVMADPAKADGWAKAANAAGSWSEYVADTSLPEWDKAKIDGYNKNLSGKILIPQIFGGKLRNLYEAESGLCVSKFMVIQLAVALVMILVFSWVGKQAQSGSSPKGRLWNMLETFLLFIRDQIARPAIGAHHDDDHGGHGEHGHGHDDHHGKHAVHVHHNPYEQADGFVPLLWTIFFFVLISNLCGTIPWVGAPTGSWSVTLALALVTFAVVIAAGMKQFGFLGFFVNQVPSMDLPLPIAIVLKPMIFAIEMLGLLIKHLVLSIRLLANMVAGHLVILAFMGMAFGAEAALQFSKPDVPGWQWYVTAVVAVVGVTAVNLLELMVAFLQAYIFTFLSALFIGASVHKH